MRPFRIAGWEAACLLTLAHAVSAGPVFRVSLDKGVREQAATGRLIIYLVRDGSGIKQAPSEGPFWEDPQPLYGVDVKNLAPGGAADIDDHATSFPVVLNELPAGAYHAQAVLDMHHDNSEWKREPGNLYSDPIAVTIGDGRADQAVSIVLNHAVPNRTPRRIPAVDFFETRSALLSDFHRRDIMLRAGIVLPIGYDPALERRYPAVYEVPGFGGDQTGAIAFAMQARSAPADSPLGRIARNCFWIIPDPESGNGHTLWADSANNGPCGQALIKELIPALEAKYKLIAAPSARLLRGHSSGGWSTLWLALTYPDTFSATWSTSPDPVDFHRFQLPNIYEAASMYRSPHPPGDPAASADLLPSYRVAGKPTMTIMQENLMEEVLGPDNTSGQQWDSWQAVFGPRNERGNPAALYDPKTGDLNRTIAEQYRKYDIAALLQAHPEKYLPLFRESVRIIVGDQDSFYLNEAVSLLRTQVEELNSKAGQAGGWGFIRVLPGYDHGSIMSSPELSAIPQEMLDRLQRAGHIPEK